MATRLEALKVRLQLYLDQEKAILESAQKYGIGSRNLERAPLDKVQEMIRQLEIEIASIENGGRNKAIGIIPRDF